MGETEEGDTRRTVRYLIWALDQTLQDEVAMMTRGCAADE